MLEWLKRAVLKTVVRDERTVGSNPTPAAMKKGCETMQVTYIIKDQGLVLTKYFDSEYLCRKFVNKLKRSKKCLLVSYPLFK